jgi:hypothetical protein
MGFTLLLCQLASEIQAEAAGTVAKNWLKLKI